MVQNVQFIGDRNSRSFQVFNCAKYTVVFHVACRVVVESHNEYAGMPPTTCLYENVQILVVIVIPRKQNEFLLHCVG